MNLDRDITKEWLITNGIGGYASSTIIGCNTRKYHGLLVAPLKPPALRYLILSKLDESIEYNNNKYNLYTNMYKNNISRGYQYITEFNNKYFPSFTYKVDDITIKKMVCMEYGKNVTCVLYKIINGNHKTKLTLAPVISYRNAHVADNFHVYDIEQEITGDLLKVVLDRHYDTPIFMKMSEGKYYQHNYDVFKGMYYIEEEKRGFAADDNLMVPGRYEIEIGENEEREVSFICSLNENIDDINVGEVMTNEIVRLRKLIRNSELYKFDENDEEKEDMIRQYIISVDNFIAYRDNTKLHTVLAGFPWFLDWGRDALISFEGLLLIPRRYEIAKEIILTFTNNIKNGLVPNGFSDDNNVPLYNSADASLLLFEQIYKYMKYTLDIDFIKEIYPKLQQIIRYYIEGIDLDENNIYMDDDFLIVSGTMNTQNTWMDVKYDGYAITPRNGKAVEINALWYNALKIMEELARIFEGEKISKEYAKIAENCKKSYNSSFYNNKKKCLFDVIGDGRIRPNQLFALSLTYPVIDPKSEIAKNIISTVERKLLTPYGLRTLAPGEPNYTEVYEGDSFRRDLSYHQGPVWPWLLGLYYDALKNRRKSLKDTEEAEKIGRKIDKLQKNTKKTFMESLYKDGVMGSISEIYDTIEPFIGKAAPAQAWSVAEIYRIILGK
jgi:predicted glycogen debranching enzyme